MQNISVKPNFNMNEIQNKNILMPNFNYNYNFNLGQLKPIDDPSKIDLYNNSLMIFDKLQNTYSNNTISANDIYNTYNYSLKNLKNNSEDLKLEDISKRAHFYFYLYNLINKKKCQKISDEEYKCNFLNTNIPFQPNNKKIQININNNLFNGTLMNNGLYTYNNNNNLLNNSMSTTSASNMTNNFLFSFDNNKDKNQFLNKKRNLVQNNLNIGNTPQCNNNMNNNNNNNMNQPSNKKKKKKNRNKNRNKNKNKNKNNNVNKQKNEDSQVNHKDIINNNNTNNNNNNSNQDKINNLKKKKESPMIQLEKDDSKNKKLKQINKPKNINSTNNNINNNNHNSLVNNKEQKELQLFEKDLKDYLKRTMSDIRKNTFFKNILPQSVKFMKNLFNKDSDVQINQMYPIYRNTIAEISLKIEPGGRIKICNHQLKE